MPQVTKYARIKINGAMQKQPILQWDSAADAAAHYGPDATLILINRGLKSALSDVIKSAVVAGTDVLAAEQAFVPSSKVRASASATTRKKGAKRLVSEAIKEGRVSAEQVEAFLKSVGQA